MLRSVFPDGDLAEAIERAAAAEGGLRPDLPGRVYEQRRAGDRQRRRADAVYYTPAHLVELTVENTLGPLLDRATDPLSVRVVDPSCGGGAFLLAAIACFERRVPGSAGEVVRRCLRGIDIDPIAARVCRLAVQLAVPGATAAELERAIVVGNGLDAEVAPPGSADALVTNPPWGQKGFRMDPALRRAYRERFACGKDAFDPCALFVEWAHHVVAPGGRFGLVLPDVLLLKNHERLRRFLLEHSRLELIAHAGRAFAGAHIDSMVLIAEAATPAADHRVSVWHSVPEDWADKAPNDHHRPQAWFGELPRACFNLYIESSDRRLLEHLAQQPRLGQLFEIHEGVHSGNARRKLFVDRVPPGAPATSYVPLVIGGKELARYRLSWAGAHLCIDPSAVDRDAGDYANLGRAAWYGPGKLVVRRTGDRVICAHDDDGRWVSNNLFVVVPRHAMPRHYRRAYEAILNSSLCTWWFRVQVPRVGRLFAEIKIQHLVDMPLAELDDDRAEALCQLADQRSQPGNPRQEARLDRHIDELVEDIVGISPADGRHIRMKAE